jgi:hypothetical protein
MGDKRQKNQMLLAFMREDRGEAPGAGMPGTEPPAATRETEHPAEDERLMEVICNRENRSRGASSGSSLTAQPIEPPCTDPYARWCDRESP